MIPRRSAGGATPPCDPPQDGFSRVAASPAPAPRRLVFPHRNRAAFAFAANPVAFAPPLRQSFIMAVASNSPGRRPLAAKVGGFVISLVVAAALVGATTLLRAALSPHLGVLSPFMLYIVAVLAAGLLRGPLCGALVMLGGGVVGFRLFLSPGGVNQHGAELALMMFWGVSALVLLTANELRVQLKGAMERLSAALQRHGPASR